jgi:hypothetical protein
MEGQKINLGGSQCRGPLRFFLWRLRTLLDSLGQYVLDLFILAIAHVELGIPIAVDVHPTILTLFIRGIIGLNVPTLPGLFISLFIRHSLIGFAVLPLSIQMVFQKLWQKSARGERKANKNGHPVRQYPSRRLSDDHKARAVCPPTNPY